MLTPPGPDACVRSVDWSARTTSSMDRFDVFERRPWIVCTFGSVAIFPPSFVRTLSPSRPRVIPISPSYRKNRRSLREDVDRRNGGLLQGVEDEHPPGPRARGRSATPVRQPDHEPGAARAEPRPARLAVARGHDDRVLRDDGGRIRGTHRGLVAVHPDHHVVSRNGPPEGDEGAHAAHFVCRRSYARIWATRATSARPAFVAESIARS